jgi:hypothetical protein
MLRRAICYSVQHLWERALRTVVLGEQRPMPHRWAASDPKQRGAVEKNP